MVVYDMTWYVMQTGVSRYIRLEHPGGIANQSSSSCCGGITVNMFAQCLFFFVFSVETWTRVLVHFGIILCK